MIIKKTVTTKCLDVYSVNVGFLKYNDQFREIRKDKTRCDGCGGQYHDDDILNLAFVRNHKNIIICDSCVENLAKNSVDTQFTKGKYATN